MAEKSYTFVEETDSDNGHHWWYGLFHRGEKEAKSVKDLVDKILNDLKPGDCIKKLVIVGHGCPGNISVGNGQDGTDPKKEIDGNNEADWGPELDRLSCRFCKDGVVYLRGCNVGAESEGAEKLFKIAQHLKCAKVQAPTGVCNALYTKGEDQTVNPGDKTPPNSLPNPDKKKKKKKGMGEKTAISAGLDRENLIHFEPKQIVAARYLPRILGQDFSVEMIETHGVDLPDDLVAMLSKGFEDAVPQWLPEHAFSIDGYLQLRILLGYEIQQRVSQIQQPPGWVPPGALVGGITYYSVLRGDTTLTYILPEDVALELKKFHTKIIKRSMLGIPPTEFFVDTETELPNVVILLGSSAAVIAESASMFAEKIGTMASSNPNVMMDTEFDFASWKTGCEYNLILLGSPVDNILIKQLADEGFSTTDWATSSGEWEYIVAPYGDCDILIIGGADRDAVRAAAQELIYWL